MLSLHIGMGFLSILSLLAKIKCRKKENLNTKTVKGERNNEAKPNDELRIMVKG